MAAGVVSFTGSAMATMPRGAPSMATKIAVTGATGRLGSQVVDVLDGRGHEVVPISRSNGVDVVMGT